jgi:HEAT repeat protein
MASKTSKTTKVQTVAGRVELLRKAAGHDQEEFLTILSKAFNDRSPTVRDTAVLVVIEHKLKDAAELVESLLRDNNENVRYDAAQCVGILQRGRKSSPPGLYRLLRDKRAIVRAQAVESIGLLEDQRALPKIVPLLSDKDPVVRSYAASTVGTLGGFVYLKNIRRGLVREKHELARVGFYEALFLLGERDVLPEMLKLLQSSDYHVRCSVANTLEVMPLATSDVELATTALLAASRKPCAVADQTTTSRVLKALRNPGSNSAADPGG